MTIDGKQGVWGNRGMYVRDISSQHALHNFHLDEEVDDCCATSLVCRKRVYARTFGRKATVRFGFRLLRRHPSFGQTRRKDVPALLAELIPYEVGGMWIKFRASLLRFGSLKRRIGVMKWRSAC